MSSTEIVPVSSSLPDSFAVYSLPLNLLKQLAVDVAKGGLYFKGQSPEAIYSAILTGLELGLPPMKALRSIHLVQGRPVLSADLMVGLCKQSSVCLHLWWWKVLPKKQPTVPNEKETQNPLPILTYWKTPNGQG